MLRGRRTACLLYIRAANLLLGAERPAAHGLFVGFVETVPVDCNIDFHTMMPALAVVGEVEDPVMVLRFRLNVMALAVEVVESRRHTAGSFESVAGMSMP